MCNTLYVKGDKIMGAERLYLGWSKHQQMQVSYLNYLAIIYIYVLVFYKDMVYIIQ